MPLWGTARCQTRTRKRTRLLGPLLLGPLPGRPDEWAPGGALPRRASAHRARGQRLEHRDAVAALAAPERADGAIARGLDRDVAIRLRRLDPEPL